MPDYTVDVGVRVRRRWAIVLGGWFLSLVRIDVTAGNTSLGSKRLRPAIHIGLRDEDWDA